MNFNEIKTLTYIEDIAIIDERSIQIATMISEGVEAVQFHKGRDFCIEEPLMEKVPLAKYQYVLDEFEEKANIIDNPLEVEPTPEEIKRQLKIQGETYTLNGIDYQVPFMKDDADGLIQVGLSFDKGYLTETVIHFSNGTKMPISNTDFEDFASWFVSKRNGFFIS